MKALDQLAALLDGQAAAPREAPSPGAAGDNPLDSLIGELRRRVDTGTRPEEPEDQQRAAVQRFWKTEQIDSLRSARLLCFGLVLPRGPEEPCLIDDAGKLAAVLAAVDQWRDDPRRFRRCVQGLIRSYFALDPAAASTTPATRQNWETLRDYLHARLPAIVDSQINPDWVKTALANRHLFTEAPCGPQAEALVFKEMRGDSSSIDLLCEQLGIARTSWFLRALFMARIAAATALDDAEFAPLVPSLLVLLARNPALRKRGLQLLLERHARSEDAPRRQDLLDAASAVFGNPWQPGSDVRWGDVAEPARAMVAAWAKADLIERFFTRLSRDARRAAFWRRYLKAIGNLQVVLGRDAPQAVDERRALRQMAIDSHEAQGSTHALLMTIGPLVLVEFSERGEQLHGHETRLPLPFDLAQPVSTGAETRNSLKSTENGLRLPHRDGLPNFPCWEDMFAATLKKNYGIEPGSASVADRRPHIDLRDMGLCDVERDRAHTPAHHPQTEMLMSSGQDAHWRTAEAESVPYSRSDLAIFARAHGLQVSDRSAAGEGLWIETGIDDAGVCRVLRHWGFEAVPGRGWRRDGPSSGG